MPINAGRRRRWLDGVMTPDTKFRIANLSVPRYTSYPTAPHFSADVTADMVAGWLGTMPADEAVSLYLHVPYCREICLYCGCHTKATRQESPLIDYANGLIAEIGLIAAAIGRRQPVSHIHWGGGTPSLLPRTTFLDVFNAVRTQFELLPTAEHAIELDPRSVTTDLAATLAEAGITRVSLGVQDFADDVQRAIGRIQSVAVVAAAVDHLRQAGITAINFDLMYGLPYQTVEGIAATVAATVQLAPARIALFGYAHVPWFKKHQRLIDVAALPGTQGRLALEAAARAALQAAGYRPIGLDHFALPQDAMAQAEADDQLRRNFQGYTTDNAIQLIGIGASSIGHLSQGFTQNALDVSHWRQSIAAGKLPIAKGKALSADDRLRADVIERLMCSYAVDLDAVTAAHGTTPAALADAFDALQDLVADGIVAMDGMRIRMTEDGRPFVRVAAAAFDAYLPRAAARHSVAV